MPSEKVLNSTCSCAMLERITLKKTPLFEFEVPIYKRRAVGLAAYNKQPR